MTGARGLAYLGRERSAHAGRRQPSSRPSSRRRWAPPRPFLAAPTIPSRSPLAHGGPRQAAARRPVRADEFPASTSPVLRPAAARLCAMRTRSRTSLFISSKAARPWSLTLAARLFNPGMCAGFKAGSGDGSLPCQRNRRGCRLSRNRRPCTAGDAVDYPDDDLAVVTVDGQRRMAHKDGAPY